MALKERLLRLSMAHYFNESKTEAECHRFVAQDHAAKAAGIHARYGVEMYLQYFTPSSTRQLLSTINSASGNPWVVDDHDVMVEFYFREPAHFLAVTQDPEFQTLQAQEEPYISRHNVVASLGWVETYVENGKVVHVGDDGKPTYASFEEMSQVSMS